MLIKYDKNVYFDRLIPKSSIDVYILLPIIFKILSSIAFQNLTFLNPLLIDIIKNILIFYYIRKTFKLKEKDYCEKLRSNSKEKLNKIIHNALKKKDEIRIKKSKKENKLKDNLFKKIKSYSPKDQKVHIQGNRMYNEYQERGIDYFQLNCNSNSNYNYSKKPKVPNWKIKKIKKGQYSIYYVECKKYLLSTSDKMLKLGEKVKKSKKNNNTWDIKTDSLGNVYLISNGIINGKKHINQGKILSSNTNREIKWVLDKDLKFDDGWIISKKGKNVKKSISNHERVKKTLMDAEIKCIRKVKKRQELLSLSNQNIDEMNYDPIIENIKCVGKSTTNILKKEINKSIKNAGKPEDKTTKTLVNADKKQNKIHKFNEYHNINENTLLLYSKIEVITLFFSFIPVVKNYIGQYNSNLISNSFWSVLLLYFYQDLNKNNRNNVNNYCNRRLKEGKTKVERMKNKKDNLYMIKYISLIFISIIVNSIIGVLSKKSE